MKFNDTIAMIELRICVNLRILAPLIDVGYGFGPPTENEYIKTRK